MDSAAARCHPHHRKLYRNDFLWLTKSNRMCLEESCLLVIEFGQLSVNMKITIGNNHCHCDLFHQSKHALEKTVLYIQAGSKVAHFYKRLKN